MIPNKEAVSRVVVLPPVASQFSFSRILVSSAAEEIEKDKDKDDEKDEIEGLGVLEEEKEEEAEEEEEKEEEEKGEEKESGIEAAATQAAEEEKAAVEGKEGDEEEIEGKLESGVKSVEADDDAADVAVMETMGAQVDQAEDVSCSPTVGRRGSATDFLKASFRLSFLLEGNTKEEDVTWSLPLASMHAREDGVTSSSNRNYDLVLLGHADGSVVAWKV